MLIHLSEVLSAAGKQKTYHAELLMDRFCPGEQSYEIVSREPMELTIIHEEDRKLAISGHIQMTVRFFCDRCLEPVLYPFDIHFEKEADMKESDEERRERLDEQFYNKGHQLDTEQLAMEELLMNMPMKILCREDCKGICNRCGANLNEGTCHCEEEPKDPRMAAILDIFREAAEKSDI